jgi:hypothetical protein
MKIRIRRGYELEVTFVSSYVSRMRDLSKYSTAGPRNMV